MQKLKQNLQLDATLVHAATKGLFVPCAIGLGMTADEAWHRADWLKHQPEAYITKVCDRVVEMENKEAQHV